MLVSIVMLTIRQLLVPSKGICSSWIRKRIRYCSTNKITSQNTELKCFICGNKTMLTNENNDSTDYNDYYKDKSPHAYICQSCLKREDAYEAYQQSFMQKMNNI